MNNTTANHQDCAAPGMPGIGRIIQGLEHQLERAASAANKAQCALSAITGENFAANPSQEETPHSLDARLLQLIEMIADENEKANKALDDICGYLHN